MRFPKLIEGQLYKIIWWDNNLPEKVGWMSTVECKEYTRDENQTKIKSTGFFFGKSKKFITLVGDEDLGLNSDRMRLIQIKKSCIIQIMLFAKGEKIFERE
jgi:hypothetical protein